MTGNKKTKKDEKVSPEPAEKKKFPQSCPYIKAYAWLRRNLPKFFKALRRLLKKYINMLIIIIAAMVLIPTAINIFILIYTAPYIITAEEAQSLDADCSISLGALVVGDTLCDVLEDRTQGAIDLYQSGAARKVLFSGDHGRKNYDEVNAMRKYAEKQGLPDEDIFLDHAGFSTYETMYRAKNVFCADKVIISTQRFHMARSVFLARMMGLEAYGVECDRRVYRGALRDNCRESAARVKDFFTGLFQPKPTFTGNEYPISGSGVLTHDEVDDGE